MSRAANSTTCSIAPSRAPIEMSIAPLDSCKHINLVYNAQTHTQIQISHQKSITSTFPLESTHLEKQALLSHFHKQTIQKVARINTEKQNLIKLVSEQTPRVAPKPCKNQLLNRTLSSLDLNILEIPDRNVLLLNEPFNNLKIPLKIKKTPLETLSMFYHPEFITKLMKLQEGKRYRMVLKEYSDIERRNVKRIEKNTFEEPIVHGKFKFKQPKVIKNDPEKTKEKPLVIRHRLDK